MTLERIISGGQTGVDQIALEVAQALGFATGGTAPRGWRTEAGPAPWLGTRYGLVESYAREYNVRTLRNVRDAQATIWFGQKSPGYNCTWNGVVIEKRHRPYGWMENPTVEGLIALLENPLYPIRTLNVAGNRASTNPDAWKMAEIVLRAALRPGE